MYFKLALRNAKNSIIDYLLYILTMIILMSILLVANYIAMIGNVAADFQTYTLPILIMVIVIVLVGYINKFMLKQRAKEFANYMLLGMEKKTLVQLYLFEFFMIGCICLLISIIIGLGICFILIHMTDSLFPYQNIKLDLFFISCLKTLFYFFIIEIISMYKIKIQIYKLQISQLMIEKKRNQDVRGKQYVRFWGICFCSSLFIMVLMFFCIIIFSMTIVTILISIIAIPVLATIFTSYKFYFYFLSSKRQQLPDSIHKKERLYIIAKLTSEGKTNAIINSVFCICLLFSFSSFIFGSILIQEKVLIYEINSQRWMAFLQICICIIFIVIYFSVLSLKYTIELKQQAKEVKVLYFIGKSKNQIKSFIKKQTLLTLIFPAITCFMILVLSIPFMNYKLNLILPNQLENIWIYSICVFSLTFFILYFLYFIIATFIISKKIDVMGSKEL